MTQGTPDRLLLFKVDSGEYYSLNEVGARVWELCDGNRTVADIVSVLGQEYEVPVDVIESDVLELLDGLAGEQLVVRSD